MKRAQGINLFVHNTWKKKNQLYASRAFDSDQNLIITVDQISKLLWVLQSGTQGRCKESVYMLKNSFVFCFFSSDSFVPSF